ncbi:MAG: DUF5668 domain-containing protein [archaeon]
MSKDEVRCERRFSVFPYILIVIGFIFLLQNTGLVDDAFSKLWPLLLIVPGIVMVVRDFFR